jgi:hypothetical protein
VSTTVPIFSWGPALRKQELTFRTQVQQVVSVAGDADRKDINYTKLEFGLRYFLWKKIRFKLDLKPVIDYIQNGQTGAIAELEGRIRFARIWEVWVMLGQKAWGEGIPSTYEKRVEIGVVIDF